MIRKGDMKDGKFLNELWNHPQIVPFIGDMGSFMNWEVLLRTPSLYFLIPFSDDNVSAGCFFLHPWNNICYEVHTLIMPEFRGKQVIEFAKEGIKWAFNNILSLFKIVTQIPTFNWRARALAIRMGFILEGNNSKSFAWRGKIYDQWLYGLRRDTCLLYLI